MRQGKAAAGGGGPMRRFNRAYLSLAVVWTGFVLYLNSQPSTFFEGVTFKWYHAIPHLDKLVHFTMYGVMAALLWNAVTRLPRGVLPPVSRPGWFVFLTAAIVGLMDELNQLTVPGRSADGWDLAVDWFAAGVVVAIAVFYSRGDTMKQNITTDGHR